jgi:hypothetical protein
MIEFSIVVVLLMTLLYGIITYGLMRLTIGPMYAWSTSTVPGVSAPVFHAAGVTVDGADVADLGSDGDSTELTA